MKRQSMFRFCNSYVGIDMDMFLPAINCKDESMASIAIIRTENTCRKLAKGGFYSVILEFAYDVFINTIKTNRSRFLAFLKRIGMDRICALYYANYSFALNSEYHDLRNRNSYLEYVDPDADIDIFLKTIDEKYHGDVDDCFSGDMPPIAYKLQAELIARCMYGISISFSEVTEEDIDTLANMIKDKSRNGGKEVSGVLLDWMRIFYMNQQYELGKTVLKKYILNDLTNDLVGEEVLGLTFYRIVDFFLRDFETNNPKGEKVAYIETDFPIYDTISDVRQKCLNEYYRENNSTSIKVDEEKLKEQVEDTLFKEYTGLTNEYLKIVYGYTDKYGELGETLGRLILDHNETIAKVLDKNRYDQLVFVTAILLQAHKDDKLTEQFLVEMFPYMNSVHKQRIVIQVILAQHILKSNDLEIVNILNGFFNYELGRAKRDWNTVKKIYKGMLEFLKEAKREIAANGERSLMTNELWLDILYKNGGIDAFVKMCEKCLDNGSMLNENDGKQLRKYVFAFSWHAGIWLSQLSIPDIDGYDKLPNAISYELRKKGESYSKKVEKYNKLLAFELSESQHKVTENMNIVVQRHLYQLLQMTATESLVKIQEIKSKAGEGEEETLVLIEDIIKSLTEQIMLSSEGRAYVDFKLELAQEDFITEYALNMNNHTLIEKLPNECQRDIHEYLATSQYVFDLLSSRDFKEDVDYSPAIITLTKAIERLLNLVYKQIKDNTESEILIDAINDKQKKHFINSKGLKESLEMGPLLHLLDKDFYEKWDVSRYLDITKLESFAGLELPGLGAAEDEEHRTIKVKEGGSFSSDPENNRVVLHNSIDYIRDEFRNKCAHKDPIKKDKALECREIMLDAQKLLWILLWIYNAP